MGRKNRSNSYHRGNPKFDRGRSHSLKGGKDSHFHSQGKFGRVRGMSVGSGLVPPERRKQLEEERKKRELYESSFKCDVQEMSDEQVDKLMKKTYTKRVTVGMANRGNTCFFNSCMQVLVHTIPLFNMCMFDKSHGEFCKNPKRSLLSNFEAFVKKLVQTGRPPLQQMDPFMKKILPSYHFGV